MSTRTEFKPAAGRGAVAGCFGLVGLCVVLFAGNVVYQWRGLQELDERLGAERTNALQEHESNVSRQQAALADRTAAQEATQDARLRDEAFLSGATSKQRHEAEWTLRLAHDPRMANSSMEKALLKMEQVGHDPQKTAQKALEEVAQLAAPSGSRVEVKPSGDGFTVRVAFRMSSISSNETGTITKHRDAGSMRREIRSLSGRVTKALFDYCGWRGIERLSVTCNHAMRRTLVPQNATEWERQELIRRAPVVLGRLYRVSLDRKAARLVTNWRKISDLKVIGMMTVEIDELTTLEISETSAGSEQDPVGPLEF